MTDAIGRVRVHDAELRYLRGGSGPTVVLVHTLRTQLEMWLPLLHALGPGFDVVALDLPGHGRSSAPRVTYDATYFTNTVEQFLETLDVRDIVLGGESIGGAIALGLAARRNARVSRVVSINPYDYGWGGGARRSSLLGNALFTAFLAPVIGGVVLRAGTRGVLRRILEGGLYDPRHLSSELLDQLWDCGSLQGHARAFLSLCREWRSWNDARVAYGDIRIPVVLVYGEHDWSRPHERDANARVLPRVRTVLLDACGHFASLERPRELAELIREQASHVGVA